MLERHRDDGSGHCCVCGGGGQTGRDIWPCSSRVLATEALVLERQMRAKVEPAALENPDQ